MLFLCHDLRLHKLKNRGIAYVKRSSFCLMCSISMPYLLIKTPSPLWDQEILTYIRKCLGSVPAWAVVYKCPVCIDLLLVGRRSERLCRRLVIASYSRFRLTVKQHAFATHVGLLKIELLTSWNDLFLRGWLYLEAVLPHFTCASFTILLPFAFKPQGYGLFQVLHI